MLSEICETMKYGLVNGERKVATPKQVGYCPLCCGQLVSKCGKTKIPHWAHKNTKDCDSWWERETQWHRDWKNCFPVEWQEIVHKDQIGEKHIADVKTTHGLVIEFQHSHITREERDSREVFYEYMIWVVDGARRKNDLDRFNAGTKFFKRTPMANVFFVPFPKKVLAKEWLDSKKIVILDFNGTISNTYPSNEQLAMFWRPNGKSLMQCMYITKYTLISWITKGELVALLRES